MSLFGPVAFATSVASRYATSLRRQHRAGRVLLQLGRRAAVRAQARAPRTGLTLRLTHRLIAEDRTRVRLTRAHTLVQRVERHLAATRYVLERTQRVEQVPLRSGTLPRLLPGTSPRGAAPAPLPIVVPPLPRVLRRSAAIPPAPTERARSFESAGARKQSVTAPPSIDIAQLTDEVMRGIDKRLAAWRERRGRV